MTKIINPLILIAISLLAACGTAALPEPVEVAPQALPSPTNPPTPSPVQTLLLDSNTSPIATPTAAIGRSPIATPTIEENSLPTATPEEEPSEASANPLPGTEMLVAKAKETLTQLPGLDITPDDITLEAIEAMQWRDSSLGCPREGLMYNQVITPGYLILLKADSKLYEFHTNTTDAVVLCLIDGEDALKVLQP